MSDIEAGEAGSEGYELRYTSLFDAGRGLSFPCDQDGRVSLDEMTETMKSNYLFARHLVGRDFGHPEVRRVEKRIAACR